MLRNSGFAFCLITSLFGSLDLAAQASVPYSVSQVRGQTIIQNYYDPNATPNVGPGLAPSPLESRWREPLGVPRGSTPLGGVAPTYGGASTTTTNMQGPSTQIITNQPPQVQQQAAKAIAPPKFEKIRIPSHFEEPTYLFPGLVAWYGKQWVGSDYLFDMPANIGVVVEVVKPEGKAIDIDQNSLKQLISGIFTSIGINPESEAIGSKPPLPFFHLLILAYPIDNKYTAYISGRLFEEVKITRLDFEPNGIWQAITWEKQDLVITSSSQFNDQIAQTTAEIAQAFVDRIRFFQDLKLQRDSEIRLKGESSSMLRMEEGYPARPGIGPGQSRASCNCP